MAQNNIDYRSIDFDYYRTYQEDKRLLKGYASVYGNESRLIGGFFTEIIEPGAFDGVPEYSDMRVLLNHDKNQLLARQKSGTLRAWSDSTGLAFEFSLPESRNDILELIQRGDLQDLSFAFTVAEGGDTWEEREDGTYLRRVQKVSGLYDITLATYPAYEKTILQSADAAKRSFDAWKETLKPKQGINAAYRRRRWYYDNIDE